ncbi:MAG TPA: hypothetical protein HA254_04160 [Candidatus Diapherotrites archaeon]|uniref:N-acetyltransferase domain-containing protein n=1 Tax=Candidatus Iainarchaeum sp. TaxID=3101447 RepID=A0A7J4J1A5_9ARCH|nr:hypothetical protein [Candidatus Diapherotrites archaeon]
MPRKSRKIICVNSEHRNPKLFGVALRGLKAGFMRRFPDSNNAKFYYIPQENTWVIKTIDRDNYQRLYEISRINGKINFSFAGYFDPTFDTREIFKMALRGKGLGLAALKDHLRLAALQGKETIFLNSARRSALLMFLRNGFTVDLKASAGALGAMKIRSQAGLMQLLKRRQTPEDLSRICGQNLIQIKREIRKNP